MSQRLSRNRPHAFDAYAPPATHAEQQVSRSHGFAALRWTFGILAVIYALVAAGIYSGVAHALPRGWQALLHLLTTIASVGSVLCLLVWTHRAWTALRLEGAVHALVRFGIPVYNLFWLLACQQRICDEIDMLSETPQAPRNLAVLAPAATISVVAMTFAQPLRAYAMLMKVAALALWFLYFSECDRELIKMKAESSRRP